jgi:hypothetical protein
MFSENDAVDVERLMKDYQTALLSFGQQFAKSRWATLILTLIGITYFADFMSNTIRTYEDPSQLTPLNIFNSGGLLALSLSAGYLVFLRMASKEVESRKVLFVIFVAAAWGAFAPLMNIYPWNFVLMIAWIIVGLLICRRSQWELVERRGAEHDRT